MMARLGKQSISELKRIHSILRDAYSPAARVFSARTSAPRASAGAGSSDMKSNTSQSTAEYPAIRAQDALQHDPHVVSNHELTLLASSLPTTDSRLASSLMHEVAERCDNNSTACAHFSVSQLCTIAAGVLRSNALQCSSNDCASLSRAMNSIADTLGCNSVLAVHSEKPSSAMLLHELSRVSNPPPRSLLQQKSRIALDSLTNTPSSFSVSDLAHLTRALVSCAHVQLECTAKLTNIIDRELCARLENEPESVPVADMTAAVSSLLRIGSCSARTAELAARRATAEDSDAADADSHSTSVNPLCAAMVSMHSY